jgi:hypothetical protein
LVLFVSVATLFGYTGCVYAFYAHMNV